MSDPLDMHWNPALEAQAFDRVYRVGQTRDVTIHRFVCTGTVEEKIRQVATVIMFKPCLINNRSHRELSLNLSVQICKAA